MDWELREKWATEPEPDEQEMTAPMRTVTPGTTESFDHEFLHTALLILLYLIFTIDQITKCMQKWSLAITGCSSLQIYSVLHTAALLFWFIVTVILSIFSRTSSCFY